MTSFVNFSLYSFSSVRSLVTLLLLGGIVSCGKTKKEPEASSFQIAEENHSEQISDNLEDATKKCLDPATGNVSAEYTLLVVMDDEQEAEGKESEEVEQEDEKEDKEKDKVKKKDGNVPKDVKKEETETACVSPTSGASAPVASLVEGEKIYQGHCLGCHGALPGAKQGRSAQTILGAASVGPHKNIVPWPAGSVSSLSPQAAAEALGMVLAQ